MICISPPGKYMQQDEQADAAREQRGPAAVSLNSDRQPAHPQRAEDRARDRAEAADDRGGDDADRLFGRERLRRRQLLADA